MDSQVYEYRPVIVPVNLFGARQGRVTHIIIYKRITARQLLIVHLKIELFSQFTNINRTRACIIET